MESLDKKVAFDNPESTPPYIKPKILNCLDGFSQGISNPVPLAEISYCLDEVRFINGITRMSYLVSFCDSSITLKLHILKEKAIRTIQFPFLTTAMFYAWKFHLSFFLKKECIEQTG